MKENKYQSMIAKKKKKKKKKKNSILNCINLNKKNT